MSNSTALAGLALIRLAVAAAPLGPRSGLLRLRAQGGASVGARDAGAEARNCAESARSKWEWPNVDHYYHGQWQSLRAPTPMPQGPPKPAFLMMAYARMAFPESWEAFFRGGDRWKLLLHVKECSGAWTAGTCRQYLPEFFQPYVQENLGPNGFCKLGLMMLRMMNLALVDPEVSHMVFLSGDSAPVRPLAAVTAELAQDPRSRFCVDKEWERAETWSVMRREHASLFNSNIPVLTGMLGNAATCEEEDWFYFALKTRKEEVLDQCVMMTDWSNSPKAWNRVATACQCPALVGGTKTPGSCSHPAVFWNITAAGFAQLVDSPAGFWFARKFPGDGSSAAARRGVAWIDGQGALDAVNARRLRDAARR